MIIVYKDRSEGGAISGDKTEKGEKTEELVGGYVRTAEGSRKIERLTSAVSEGQAATNFWWRDFGEVVCRYQDEDSDTARIETARARAEREKYFAVPVTAPKRKRRRKPPDIKQIHLFAIPRKARQA